MGFFLLQLRRSGRPAAVGADAEPLMMAEPVPRDVLAFALERTDRDSAERFRTSDITPCPRAEGEAVTGTLRPLVGTGSVVALRGSIFILVPFPRRSMNVMMASKPSVSYCPLKLELRVG